MNLRLLQYMAVGIAVILCLLPPPATAAGSFQKEILLATRIDLPPYVENKAQTGIEIDLIEAVFAGSPYRPVYIQQPRVRMISSFESGQLDGILTQNIQASRKGCATDIYISHENVAKTIASKKIQINQLRDLSGRSVLSFDGATRYIGKVFEDAVRAASSYTETNKQANHISLLYKGRFDIVVGDRWILQLVQKKLYDKTGKYIPLKTHSILGPSHYVARFHEKQICDYFNKSLSALKSSGQYASIWSKYENRLQFSQVFKSEEN